MLKKSKALKNSIILAAKALEVAEQRAQKQEGLIALASETSMLLAKRQEENHFAQTLKSLYTA